MILFHLSENLFHNGKFYPQVPRSIMDNEEKDIERVCVSTTIEGCLTAMPNGGSKLDCFIQELLEFNRNSYLMSGFKDENIPDFKLFKIDTEKIGISQENIINYETLYKKNYVRDAYWTEECWITEKFSVPDEDISYIKIEDWQEEEFDMIPADIFYQAMDGDGDYIGLYQKKMKEIGGDLRVPFIHLIKDVQYRKVDF
ncbi:MAG: hypothetical protein ACOCQR_01700 [bacterium]